MPGERKRSFPSLVSRTVEEGALILSIFPVFQQEEITQYKLLFCVDSKSDEVGLFSTRTESQ